MNTDVELVVGLYTSPVIGPQTS